MNKDCIFCLIVTDKSNLIYEDTHTAAFMDINPITKGHTLVIPKQHYDNFLNCPATIVANVNSSAHKIANTLLKVIPAITGFNILTNNGTTAFQEVFHYHVHIIPKYSREKGLLINKTTENVTIKDTNNVKTLLKKRLIADLGGK